MRSPTSHIPTGGRQVSPYLHSVQVSLAYYSNYNWRGRNYRVFACRSTAPPYYILLAGVINELMRQAAAD